MLRSFLKRTMLAQQLQSKQSYATCPTRYEVAQETSDIIAEGYAAAARTWRASMAEGENGRPADSVDDTDDGDTLRQTGSVAPGLVPDAGAEDEEHPNYEGGPR